MAHLRIIDVALGLTFLIAIVAAGCAGPASTPNPTPEPVPPPSLIPNPTPEPVPPPSLIPNPEPTPTTAAPVATKISVEEVKSKLDSGDDIILVDVRPRADFDRNRIDTAVSMPLADLPDHYAEIPRSSEVIVYAECS